MSMLEQVIDGCFGLYILYLPPVCEWALLMPTLEQVAGGCLWLVYGFFALKWWVWHC